MKFTLEIEPEEVLELIGTDKLQELQKVFMSQLFEKMCEVNPLFNKDFFTPDFFKKWDSHVKNQST